MSRKTRKLIWSAPLVAVLAVAGALAMFVALQPNGAAAHDEGPGIMAHQPPPPVMGIDVIIPSIANGGRSSLQVSWNAPVTTGANTATMYRVDISTDTDVWMNVIGGEASSDTLTESMAMSNCTSSDEGNRCYTAPGLKADTLYHFRVFAMNDHGTSGISVDETLGSGRTHPIDPPEKASGLEATDYYEDKIVVSWDEVMDTGGADVLWYCLGVAASPSGAFTDLTDADNAAACLTAEEEVGITDAGIVTLLGTGGALVASSQTAVIAAMDENGAPVTSYTHGNLGGGNHDDDGTTPVLPDEIELRYRLYAVTDQGGDADTTDDRKIARAASEVATGSTVRPSDKPDPRFEAPPGVGNLRAVVYFQGNLETDGSLPDPTNGNQGLHFFWTHPDGYLADADGDEAGTDSNWYVQVQRRVAADAEHDDYTGWQFVTGAAGTAGLADGYATSQFTVDFTATLDATNTPPESWAAPVLWGDSKDDRHEYRVRYVNPGEDESDTQVGIQNEDRTDDVPGDWDEITIAQVTPNYLRNGTGTAVPDADSTLPIILQSTGNTGMGLRFEYNDDSARDARDHIDLLWTRNASASTREGADEPNGYVIDRSADEGATWETLDRADTPNDLGTADTFTDSSGRDHEVVPGHQYMYRVFPVFIESGSDAYGVPAVIDANSRGADLPGAARSVSAVGDGQDACLVTWTAPADDGGHSVRGYLIQIASDDNGSPDEWSTIDVVDGTPPFTVMGGDMTEFKFTGTAAQVVANDVDELSAGAVRWFRVIPITNENDGVETTGGAALGEDGDENTPRNGRGTTVPLTDDAQRARQVKCTTDGLGDAPADRVTADPQMPVDLTAEAASDTNSLGDGDRGVFLTWNMQAQGDASKTTSYRINRIRMNTGVEALNDAADDWQYVTRVSDVTSYTDSTELRRDEETRMYQVCSEASGVADPVCVDMEVDYALHPTMHADIVFSAPTNVAATSSGGTITVTWTPGAQAASQVIVAVNSADDTDFCLHVDTSGTLASHDCPSHTVGATYVVLVIALDGQGGYMLGNVGTHVAQ